MRLLIVSNQKQRASDGSVQFGSANDFIARFSEAISFKPYSQICIVAYTMEDANNSKLHYVNIPNLPVRSNMGNVVGGKSTSIVGVVISDLENNMPNQWVDLNNQSEFNLNELQIQILNQEGILSSGLTGVTEIIFGIRKDPDRQ